jgi:hypothetical protein
MLIPRWDRKKKHNLSGKIIEPIDKKFNAFCEKLQQMGKEKAMKESEDVQKSRLSISIYLM